MKKILMLLTIVLILPRGLLANTLAHWTFNKGSGDTVYDISGNGHHGVIYGNANWLKRYCHDYALEFDGIDDYVSCGVIQPYLTTSFTVEIIFKVNNTGENGNWIFSTGGNDPYSWTAIKFKIESSGVLRCDIRLSGSGSLFSVTSPGVVNDGNRHHAVFVYDNANLKLYLDGDPSPVAEAPATGTIVQQNHATYIGRYDWWGWEASAFSGVIDEVRINSTALSPDEFLSFLFAPCGDVNCDEVVDLADVLYLINYLYKGGTPPCDPALCGSTSGLSFNMSQSLSKKATESTVYFSPISRIRDGLFEVPLSAEFDMDVAGLHLEINYDPERSPCLSQA